MLYRPRVLVVDDDDSTRELIADALDSEGYEVRTARNGREGLEVGRTFEPNVILLDMLMPSMDGRAFAREFREQITKPVPIVVLTATFDSATIAAEIAADGFLDKPFSLDDLLAIVSKFAAMDA